LRGFHGSLRRSLADELAAGLRESTLRKHERPGRPGLSVTLIIHHSGC